MSVSKEKLTSLLKEGFPDGKIEVIPLSNDQDHYRVIVSSKNFNGKSKVTQHQMVFYALKGLMKEELHALSIQTLLETKDAMD
jgi:stress-induced morphogen